MKKLISVLFVTAMILGVCACAKKPVVNFTDLKLGIDKQEVIDTIGTEYKEAGTTPDRLIFENVQLFDFIKKDTKTKLTVNLNLDNKAYAYSYYVYEDRDSNYKKIKEHFESLYGPAAEGENASEIWVADDGIYYLFNQNDYVAIGIN